MRAGKLDRRVTLWHRPDPDGDLVELVKVWAEWRPASAARRVEAHATADGVEGQLRIRDSAAARAIVQTMRARWGGQDFEILSTPVPDRSGYLWLKVGRQLGPGG